MNKQQIIEQIDELKQKIEELEKEVNSPEFEGIKKGVRQMPKKGEVYYFVDSAGYVSHTYWAGGEDDLFRFNTGNCFKTEQEAIEYKMKQIKFGFAQPEATNHIFVCTNCETPLITHKDCKPYCPTCRKSNKGKWLEVKNERKTK